jgi:hypothetical protein
MNNVHSSLLNLSQNITKSIHPVVKNHTKSIKKTKLKRKLERISSLLNTASSNRFKISLLPKFLRKKNLGCVGRKTKTSQPNTKTRTLQQAESTGTILKTMINLMVSTLGAESSPWTTSRVPLVVKRVKKSILSVKRGLLLYRSASDSTGD